MGLPSEVIRVVDIDEATDGKAWDKRIYQRISRGQYTRLTDTEGFVCVDRKTAKMVIEEAYAIDHMIPMKVLARQLRITPARFARRMIVGVRGDIPWDGTTVYGYQMGGKYWFLSKKEYQFVSGLFKDKIPVKDVVKIYERSRPIVNGWMRRFEIPHVILIGKGRTKWVSLNKVIEAVGRPVPDQRCQLKEMK
jgi:hypothetical protein